MQLSAIHQNLSPIIEPTLSAMGFRVVRVIWQGSDRRKILQLMIERQDGIDITVDDCAEASHTVSALLDVQDPIESAYELEVSSPGIDRPLVTLSDFAAYVGFDTKVETVIPLEGRRRFRGKITEITEQEVVVLVNGGEVFQVPFGQMATARLVLDDALIKESVRRNKLRLAQVEEQTQATSTDEAS